MLYFIFYFLGLRLDLPSNKCQVTDETFIRLSKYDYFVDGVILSKTEDNENKQKFFNVVALNSLVQHKDKIDEYTNNYSSSLIKMIIALVTLCVSVLFAEYWLLPSQP